MKNAQLPIIDPRDEARVLAWHLGREEGEQRAPIIPALEAAAEIRAAEIECVMSEVPA